MLYPKRLIEVDLPIKRISAHARREKSIRHGHISTLHIWWARRPLAACRAVLCASLWPDPADPLCPKDFIEFAQKEMIKWSDNELLPLLSKESYEHFIQVNHNHQLVENKEFLRTLLLDFIADFANWDNNNNPHYLNTSRSLTQAAHIAMGGEPGTKPLVVDPFAGGGSIPLEALRVGADAFASDLNPIPVLINKVQLEYIPRYGTQLADEIKKWGLWIKKNIENELKKFYPNHEERETPIAYIWARTIKCEGPNCGAEIPLIRGMWLSRKKNRNVALQIIPDYNLKKVNFKIVENIKASEIQQGTVKRGNAICPVCGFTTQASSVRRQLKFKNGGSNDAVMVCVVTTNNQNIGRKYRLPNDKDINAVEEANKYLKLNLEQHDNGLSIIPDETLPVMSGVFNAPIYGVDKWSKLFTYRQLLVITTLVKLVNKAGEHLKKTQNPSFAEAIQTCLAFVVDRMADGNSAFCRWQPSRELIGNVFGRQALPMVWDFCEANPFSDASRNLQSMIDWVVEFVEKNTCIKTVGSSVSASATSHCLPDDSANVFFTDPPYYNAVPYADLSDFFYVWLKRTLRNVHYKLFKNELSPKTDEICEMAGWDPERYSHKDGKWFETEMQKAMAEGRRIASPDSIGIVVFAHKTTSGWESQLQAMLNAGWKFTGSWPIDTEMGSRLRAMNSAALASSIHLVCRPRENPDGTLIQNQIGDWRDVQHELPKRIHEWMPRLAAEGVAGADAIFACLGPALEIFSRYTRVEKPNGDVVTLHEYLEKVWAAISQEALNMVFSGGEASGFEEDARLTAMWLWTLTAGASENGTTEEDDDDESDDEETGSSGKITGGFTLEYDTARKIAQGLGVNLDELKTLVEVKGDKARLLPVGERASKLFGSAGIQHQPVRRKKKEVQLKIQFDNVEQEEEMKYEMPELKVEQSGKTVLDRLHQAMLLFSYGRTDALKRFLVEDGAGKDDRFWKLAQALTSLYPKDSDERRWVEAVQTYKKSLGF
ncbi:MAG TPA: DUF1156 domain-containing protein [Bacteroidia bacterium]|nr:DUF1156 domain-containing protein [Bacteroidia bacterium]